MGEKFCESVGLVGPAAESIEQRQRTQEDRPEPLITDNGRNGRSQVRLAIAEVAMHQDAHATACLVTRQEALREAHSKLPAGLEGLLLKRALIALRSHSEALEGLLLAVRREDVTEKISELE